MNQTKQGSIVEALSSTAIGFIINWLGSMFIYPAFGWHVSLGTAFNLSLVFTAISIARGYVIRRVFNRIPYFHHYEELA